MKQPPCAGLGGRLGMVVDRALAWSKAVATHRQMTERRNPHQAVGPEHGCGRRMVGVGRFELPTSRSRTVRSCQAELHPAHR